MEKNLTVRETTRLQINQFVDVWTYLWKDVYTFRTAFWFDPGETTGWAALLGLNMGKIGPYVPGSYNPQNRQPVFLSGQLPRLELGLFLQVVLGRVGSFGTVGYERFLITPGSHVAHDQSAIKAIGVIEQFTALCGLKLIGQAPSSSRVAGLRALEVAGWKIKSSPHANDAAAHLLTFLLATNQAPRDVADKVEIALMGKPWQF